MRSTATAYACRPLSNPRLNSDNSVYNRVVTFDPAQVYANLGSRVNHFLRIQTNITMCGMFNIRHDGICACGCEQVLGGRRTRWATEDCSVFANTVFNIIMGRSETINRIMIYQIGDDMVCMGCAEVLDYATAVKRKPWDHCIELDHVLDVKQGGGGCWLANYQRLCIPCHNRKTKTDGAALRLMKKNHTDQITLL